MKGLVFTYILTYGGVAASLINPFIGLLVYVAFAILKPDSLWQYSLPQGGRFSLIVSLGLLAGWTLHGFGNWRFGRARGAVVCLLFFWVWLVVSAWFAVDGERAWWMVEQLSKIYLPCLVAITLVNSIERLKQLAWVVAICQGYLAYEFNVQYYKYGFNDNEWKFGGLDNNGMAIAMVTGVGLAFFLGLHVRSWLLKLTAFSSAALMTHFVLFSMSRGGMLGLGVTGVVVFLVLPKRPMHCALFFLGVLLALRLAGPAVLEEFSTIAEGDAKSEGGLSRTELWKACIVMAFGSPLTGVGPDNFREVAHSYGFARGKASHTTWLNVLAEEGFPGFAAFAGFFGLTALSLWPCTRLRRPVPDPWMRHLARAVVASLAGYAVSAQFVAVEGLEMPYYIAIVGAGVLRLASIPSRLSAPVILAQPPRLAALVPQTAARSPWRAAGMSFQAKPG